MNLWLGSLQWNIKKEIRDTPIYIRLIIHGSDNKDFCCTILPYQKCSINQEVTTRFVLHVFERRICDAKIDGKNHHSFRRNLVIELVRLLPAPSIVLRILKVIKVIYVYMLNFFYNLIISLQIYNFQLFSYHSICFSDICQSRRHKATKEHRR